MANVAVGYNWKIHDMVISQNKKYKGNLYPPPSTYMGLEKCGLPHEGRLLSNLGTNA